MAIEDKTPEARNLVVLSFSIVVFYLAGGVIVDNEVHLNFINIKFQNPIILACLIWLLLFWFLFRYWQVNKGKLSSNYKNDFRSYMIFLPFKRLFASKAGVEKNKNIDHWWAIIQPHNDKWIFQITIDTTANLNEFGQINGRNGPGNEKTLQHTLSSFEFFLYAIVNTPRILWKSEHVVEFAFPYFSFFVAFIFGCISAGGYIYENCL